ALSLSPDRASIALRSFPTRRSSDLGSLARRRRQHRVLGGEPAPPPPRHPSQHPFGQRGGAEDARSAHADQRRSVGAGEEVRLDRSEEHTSELQSPYDLVCRPLLEKK